MDETRNIVYYDSQFNYVCHMYVCWRKESRKLAQCRLRVFQKELKIVKCTFNNDIWHVTTTIPMMIGTMAKDIRNFRKSFLCLLINVTIRNFNCFTCMPLPPQIIILQFRITSCMHSNLATEQLCPYPRVL